MTVDGLAAYPFTDTDRAQVARGSALGLLPSVARRGNDPGSP